MYGQVTLTHVQMDDNWSYKRLIVFHNNNDKIIILVFANKWPVKDI